MKYARNLHVPMTSELHGELRRLSAQIGRPTTSVAREAIEVYLRHLQKQAIDRAIQEYAQEVAGTCDDLDAELEAAGVDFLLKDQPDASR